MIGRISLVINLVFPFIEEFITMIVDKFGNVNAFIENGLNKFLLWNWGVAERIHKLARTFFCGAKFNIQGYVGVGRINHIFSSAERLMKVVRGLYLCPLFELCQLKVL